MLNKERNFTWDKEQTIKTGEKFDGEIVKEFMEEYNVDEFKARCTLAEMYFNQVEDELLYKEIKERSRHDNGVRYSLDEVKKMCKINNK
jgi:hypothetical protein